MITQQRLHELFEYRDDGNLIRKVSVQSNAKKGDVIGSVNNDGYLCVMVDRKPYRVHRLIFLYHHGYLTDGLQMDHIDGNRTNNRIENLREVTKSQNKMNSKLAANNTSGVKGVYWHKRIQKWTSNIRLNRKHIHLGYYDTIEEAVAVVIAARNEYHGEYARHN
jgi:hypothetical protein